MGSTWNRSCSSCLSKMYLSLHICFRTLWRLHRSKKKPKKSSKKSTAVKFLMSFFRFSTVFLLEYHSICDGESHPRASWATTLVPIILSRGCVLALCMFSHTHTNFRLSSDDEQWELIKISKKLMLQKVLSPFLSKVPFIWKLNQSC